MKTNISKRGISLIILVITIVVMIIIAGVIIVSLSNSEIIDKSSNAVEVTNLKTALDVAKTKWAEAYASGIRTKEGLEAAVMSGIEKANGDLTKYKITVTTKGVKVEEAEDESVLLNPIDVVPEGAIYVAANGVTYNAGDKFPDVMMPLDRYDFGDYVYVYQANNITVPYSESNFYDQYGADTSYDGWMVTIFGKESKAQYGRILESINGKNVTNMNYTFYWRTTITEAPLIPKHVTTCNSTFEICISLASFAEGFTIPQGVTSCRNMFYLPEESLAKIVSLPEAFTIPASVVDVQGMFHKQALLQGAITIDANPTNYSVFLYQCDTSKINIAGKTTMKNELLATAN